MDAPAQLARAAGGTGDGEDMGDADETAELTVLMRATIGRLYRRFRSERAEGALGDTALEVLIYLEKNGPQNLTQLSEAGRVTPASMSQSVNRLTSAGYAVRVSDPDDRRRVRFRTTPEGAALAAETSLQRNAWLGAQLQQLGSEDREVVARACAIFGAIADS